MIATHDDIAARLDEARARTFELIEPLTDEDLHRQHDPLMSPIIWDLGHIAHFEELWLVRNLEGPVEFGEMPGIYNPFEHPRKVRGELQLPSLDECRTLLNDVRARVLRRLESADFANGDELLRNGYVYNMVLQHEYQHNETILQTLQLKQGAPYAASRRYTEPRRPSSRPVRDSVRFGGGRVIIGTDDRTIAYDNERPAHERDVAPFSIDVFPVTNDDYREFIRARGYTTREFWSDAGWAWLQEARVEAPKYWIRDGDAGSGELGAQGRSAAATSHAPAGSGELGAKVRNAAATSHAAAASAELGAKVRSAAATSHIDWCVRVMDRVEPLRPELPVCHVSYYEAEAFARFAGKRLPTEFEWEVAARWSPRANSVYEPKAVTASHANVDQLSFGTMPIASYGQNWSPLGCYGMIGDVWEWTSSDFLPYPGYRTFPYPEYSEVFFGSEYKVLRGGSWATRPAVARATFRNWDYPIRRQIFSGFRCARDD
ncbi:MAG TPA: ergothioneine biosynthesis protein EgtB [Gemmatimonadaceae bacterium]|nr:ergothioneine biosynthesis protein EgtB [Gemmatimonadaceae bacterium]